MQQCCTIASTTSFKASSLGHDWVNQVHLNINLPITYHALLFLPVRRHQAAASLFSQTIISASAHLSSLVSLSASSFSRSPLLAHLSLPPLPWLMCSSYGFIWLQEASGHFPFELKAKVCLWTGHGCCDLSAWCREVVGVGFQGAVPFVRWSNVK